MNETVWRTCVGAVLAAALVASCASSGSQKRESGTAEASSPDDGAASEGRGRMEVDKRIHFEETIGEPLKGEKPPGCEGDWQRLDDSRYPGKPWLCGRFNGPDRWGTTPVTIIERNGRIAVIRVQVFYDSVSDARGEYSGYVGKLLERCDREAGFERYVVVGCDDYVVDVSWRPTRGRAKLEVVYAVTREILEKGQPR